MKTLGAAAGRAEDRQIDRGENKMAEGKGQAEHSIDELAEMKQRENIGRAVMAGGVIAYLAALVVGVVRNIELFSGTFRTTGYEWIGICGVAALGINAIVLPLFLHYRASGTQFLATVVFYAADLGILFLNSIIDSHQVNTQSLTGFAAFYYDNVLFATPVLVMLGWAVLWILDPASQKQRAIVEARGGLIRKLSKKITGATQTVDVDKDIERQAHTYTAWLASEMLLVPKSKNGTTPESTFTKNSEIQPLDPTPPTAPNP